MFFEVKIRHILVYGYIYSDGMFEINMWDFNADDYWFRDGRKENIRKAWHEITHLARHMDRVNHNFDVEAAQEVEKAMELFFDEDFELSDLDES